MPAPGRLLALAQRLRALQAGATGAAAAARAGAASAAAASPPRAAAAATASAARAPAPPLLLRQHRHHQQHRTAWTDSKGYTHFGERPPAFAVAVGFGPTGPGVNRAVAAALGASVGGLGLYWWHCRETVPFTGRKHSIMFVSPEMERQMGVQTYQHMKSEAAAQGALLPDNHPAARLVARVGGRLAAVAAEGDGNDSRSSSSSFSSSSSLSSSSSSSKSSAAISHMRGLKWEFAVVDSPQVNAMVAPGGKVIVYTGLLRLVKGNEDELAAVLAHEAAHVLARHHAERMGRANAAAFLNVLARWLLGVPIPGAVVALALVLPHSRANEREADAIGVRLAARACFDPAANVRMLQRLASAEGGGGGGSGGLALLRTHPITSERVEAVRALLPKAMGEYEARCAVARAVLLEDRAYAAATAAPGPLG